MPPHISLGDDGIERKHIAYRDDTSFNRAQKRSAEKKGAPFPMRLVFGSDVTDRKPGGSMGRLCGAPPIPPTPPFQRGFGGGGFLGRLIPFHRLGFLDQSQFQNLAHMGHGGDDFQPVFHIVRNIGQVLLVLFRDQHRLDAPPAEPPAASP